MWAFPNSACYIDYIYMHGRKLLIVRKLCKIRKRKNAAYVVPWPYKKLECVKPLSLPLKQSSLLHFYSDHFVMCIIVILTAKVYSKNLFID